MNAQILIALILLSLAACRDSGPGGVSASPTLLPNSREPKPTGTFEVTKILAQKPIPKCKIPYYGMDSRLKAGQQFYIDHIMLMEDKGFSSTNQEFTTITLVDPAKRYYEATHDMIISGQPAWVKSRCNYSNDPNSSSKNCDLVDTSPNLKNQVQEDLKSNARMASYCTVENSDGTSPEPLIVSEEGIYTFMDGRKVKAVRTIEKLKGVIKCKKDDQYVAVGEGNRDSIRIITTEIPTLGLTCGDEGDIFDFRESKTNDGQQHEFAREEIVSLKE